MHASLHSNEPARVTRYFSVSASRVVLALALVSLWTVISLAAPQTAPARAELVLDATRRDYGEVFAGEELDYPFNISNVGKAPLELAPRSLTSRSLPFGNRVSTARLDTRPERYRLVPIAARLAAPS